MTAETEAAEQKAISIIQSEKSEKARKKHKKGEKKEGKKKKKKSLGLHKHVFYITSAVKMGTLSGAGGAAGKTEPLLGH